MNNYHCCFHCLFARLFCLFVVNHQLLVSLPSCRIYVNFLLQTSVGLKRTQQCIFSEETMQPLTSEDTAIKRGRAYACTRCEGDGKEYVDTNMRVEDNILRVHMQLDQVPYYCTLRLFRTWEESRAIWVRRQQHRKEGLLLPPLPPLPRRAGKTGNRPW